MPAPPPRRWMVEVEDLHKSFDGQKVLDGVNLRIAEGSTCALMGVSGCGKTVLLKHLVGLLQPDRGRIRIDGRDLRELPAKELQGLRSHMGILFQSGALFDSLTVEENVAFPLREQLHLGREAIAERVAETLRLLGLEDCAQQLPGELSGGMRKRVAFARAIVTRPRLLLYDDPTAGLDPLRTRAVADEILLARHRLAVTQLAVTADLPTAFRIADEIALMSAGRIVVQAPTEQFRASTDPAVQAFLHEWLQLRQEADAAAAPH